MKYKYLEIRDSGTCMPALAIKMDFDDENILVQRIVKRSGFSGRGGQIYLLFLEIQACSYSGHRWRDGARTRSISHQYIEKHFDELEDGSIVDVEFILGETDTPATTDLGPY